MKMLRTLIFILIVGFVFSLSACYVDIHNATTPDLQLMYTLDLGDDVLDFVVPFESGYICCINSNEMRIVDSEGNTENVHVFDNEITDIYAEEYLYIMIALDNNEVILMKYQDNLLEEIITVQFNEQVSDISCLWFYSYNITCFVVLSNGDLYAYGDNYRNILDPDKEETEFNSEPQLLLSGVEYVYSNYAVTSENVVAFGETDIPLSLDNVEGINGYKGRPYIFTADSLYLVRTRDGTVNKVHDMDQGSFYSMQNGYIYSFEGNVYYSGITSLPDRGKESIDADNELIDLNIDGNCCVISHGILLYDEHTITCYWV